MHKSNAIGHNQYSLYREYKRSRAAKSQFGPSISIAAANSRTRSYGPRSCQRVCTPFATGPVHRANACGCVASDFAPILAQDPLIGVSELVTPNQIDSSRFVFVNTQVLEGPEQAGAGPVLNSFTESDSGVISQTNTESLDTTTSYTTGSGFDIPFLFTLTVTNTNSFTVTTSESQGTQNGSSHQASVTLGSDAVGCFEHVDIYEDTAFHTFAFALPAAAPAGCE